MAVVVTQGAACRAEATRDKAWQSSPGMDRRVSVRHRRAVEARHVQARSALERLGAERQSRRVQSSMGDGRFDGAVMASSGELCLGVAGQGAAVSAWHDRLVEHAHGSSRQSGQCMELLGWSRSRMVGCGRQR